MGDGLSLITLYGVTALGFQVTACWRNLRGERLFDLFISQSNSPDTCSERMRSSYRASSRRISCLLDSQALASSDEEAGPSVISLRVGSLPTGRRMTRCKIFQMMLER